MPHDRRVRVDQRYSRAMSDPGIPTAADFHMSPEDFRTFGHQVIDWIADYQSNVESYPVLSRVEPGEIRAGLPASPPEHGEPFADVMRDLETKIMPGVTHWQSPGFMAYFPANASGPSILGELLSAGLGVQGMLWATSPACTELESHVLDWMIDLCGLPDRFLSNGSGGGVIEDSASSSALVAMIAARRRAGGADALDRLVAYTSSHAHSSIEKNARVIGLRDDQLRLIDVDETYAMRPELLAEAMASDVSDGLVPFFVSCTSGTTSSTAFDPVGEVAQIASEHNVWVHVDAAFAGSAAVCPELRWVTAGVDLVDSYCFNPHKWLLTNFDCSLLYVADRAAIINALSVLPEYLRNEASESGAVIDYRDWMVPLGRRFRSLKLWMVIRHYGAEGLRAFIREHVALGLELASWIEADDRLELQAPRAACARVLQRTRGRREDSLNLGDDQRRRHPLPDSHRARRRIRDPDRDRRNTHGSKSRRRRVGVDPVSSRSVLRQICDLTCRFRRKIPTPRPPCWVSSDFGVTMR